LCIPWKWGGLKEREKLTISPVAVADGFPKGGKKKTRKQFGMGGDGRHGKKQTNKFENWVDKKG